ncbi:MAG: carbohydrate-binding family 9-like protein [Bacteroidales bacterium]|nr:carbohydrate-binding family 9-like protein [Bacteroidales bacterium]
MNYKNQITQITYLPEIENIDLDKISNFLDDKVHSQIIECNNWPKIYSYKPITYVKFARGEKNLFVSFSINGNSLKAVNSCDQTPVEEDSSISIALKNPINSNYYLFDFNCIGTCFASKGTDPNAMELFKKEELNLIKRYSDIGKRPFYEMEGLFSWEITVSLPLSLIDVDVLNLPKDMECNFGKIATQTSLPHFLTWNPVNSPSPTMVYPDSFGKLVF